MSRAVVLIACVVVAVGGFFLARSSGGDDTSTGSAATITTKTERAATTSTAAKSVAPAVTRVALRAKGGQPVGGTRTISVKHGQHVRITVVSDTADEAHLHGYDVERELEPGKPAVFDLKKTDLEGIFELELHHSDAVLAKLEVNP